MGMDPNSADQKTKKHSDLSAIPCYSIANIVAWTGDRCNQLFTHPINSYSSLPFGTKVRVTNLNNGRTVVVRINDRGPFRDHRVIDLAHGAAQELRMMQAGEIPVQLEILNKGPKTK